MCTTVMSYVGLAVCKADCGSHGTCTEPNTCTCDEGYKGDVCDEGNPP